MAQTLIWGPEVGMQAPDFTLQHTDDHAEVPAQVGIK